MTGPFSFFDCQLKHECGFDDALDSFCVHAMGGILNGILVAFFATVKFAAGYNGVFHNGSWSLLGCDLCALLFSIAWSALFTFLILKALDRTIGIRVSEEEDEDYRLDMSHHGETKLHVAKDIKERKEAEESQHYEMANARVG